MKYISALSLAPVFMASADALLHLGVDFELPLGISLPINVDVGPTSSPPEGCTTVWHPPHHGVDMDGCDNDDDDHWHYVHPGQPSYPSQPPHVWTTKTVTATHVSTVLSCAPEVTDCPYRHPTVTTVVVPETTTICPVAVTTGYEAPPTSEAYLPPPVATSTSEGYLPPAETTWTATTSWEEVTSTTTPCEETVTPTTTPCEETETYVESTPCEETVTPTTPCEETETYVVESTPCEETVPVVTTPCEESKTWVTKVSESTPCETPVWTTPMATPVYPPPAGYTTTPAAGSPGYCPGPGCPSPTNAVGTVTHPAYATPTASVVQVTGAAAQNGHTVGGFVAVAAALIAALL